MFETRLVGMEEAQRRLRMVHAMLEDTTTMRRDLAASAQPMAALARELSPHAYEYPAASPYNPSDSSADWNWMSYRGTYHNVRGTLRNSINVIPRMGTTPTVAVTARTPYARAQEYGAFITPRKARFLHFIGKGGEDVFTRAVHLPPRPYMRPAYESLWPEVPIHLAVSLALRFAAAFGGRIRRG